MDALISHLKSTGTGTNKLALIERIAKGREARDCTAELVAALNAAGHVVTANKVLAFCAEPEQPATVGTVGLGGGGDAETHVGTTDAEETATVDPKARRRWSPRSN